MKCLTLGVLNMKNHKKKLRSNVSYLKYQIKTMNLVIKYKKSPKFWGLYALGAWGCIPLTTKREREEARGGDLMG